jgi:hypothetical protein
VLLDGDFKSVHLFVEAAGGVIGGFAIYDAFAIILSPS